MGGVCGCLRTGESKRNTDNTQFVRRSRASTTTASYYTADSDTTMMEEEPDQSFIGIRTKIPSRTDLKRHPSSMWWSDARLDAPHVVKDFGDTPKTMSRTVKVKVVDTAPDTYFPDDKCFESRRRHIVLRLILGKKTIVSCAQVDDVNGFDSLFMKPYVKITSLLHTFKLIVNPANGGGVPWAMTGPKDAYSIADFFGETNCSVERDYDRNCLIVSIDVYSKFIVKTLLPRIAFQQDRISDYLLVDYPAGIIVTGFRIVCTETFLALLNNSYKPSYA